MAFMKYWSKIAEGAPDKGNHRAMQPQHNLSAEDQADCLIDLATDPNVLGRAWRGWKSWL